MRMIEGQFFWSVEVLGAVIVTSFCLLHRGSKQEPNPPGALRWVPLVYLARLFSESVEHQQNEFSQRT